MKDEDMFATLSVRFDADQTSSQLQWLLKDFNGEARVPAGTNAGAIYFFQGETLSLEIIGGGSKASNFTSFQIIDCCIISVPEVVACADGKTRYARPSPFLQSTGASYPVSLDFSSSLDKSDESYRQISQEWKQSLNIGHTPGRWELSFYLTVLIYRDPAEAPEVRVFQFDPESEVGTGTRGE